MITCHNAPKDRKNDLIQNWIHILTPSSHIPRSPQNSSLAVQNLCDFVLQVYEYWGGPGRRLCPSPQFQCKLRNRHQVDVYVLSHLHCNMIKLKDVLYEVAYMLLFKKVYPRTWDCPCCLVRMTPVPALFQTSGPIFLLYHICWGRRGERER